MRICESKTHKNELKGEIKNEVKDELKNELKSEIKKEIKNFTKNAANPEVFTGQRIIPVEIITKVR